MEITPTLKCVDIKIMVVANDDLEASHLAVGYILSNGADDSVAKNICSISDEVEIPKDWWDRVPPGDIPPEWGLGPYPNCIEIYNKLKELQAITHSDSNQLILPGFEKYRA